MIVRKEEGGGGEEAGRVEEGERSVGVGEPQKRGKEGKEKEIK